MSPAQGGYDAFSFDIGHALKGTGAHEILVAVFDPSESGRQPFGKQRTTAMYSPAGDTYTPVSGIWQEVWVETVPKRHISDLRIFADTKALHLNVQTSVPDAGLVNITVTARGEVVATGVGRANLPFSVAMPDHASLWSPESPFLYNFTASYGADVVESYFGASPACVLFCTVSMLDAYIRLVLDQTSLTTKSHRNARGHAVQGRARHQPPMHQR